MVEDGIVGLEVMLKVEMSEKRDGGEEVEETLGVEGGVEVGELEVSERGKAVREMAKGEVGDVGEGGKIEASKRVLILLRRGWISRYSAGGEDGKWSAERTGESGEGEVGDVLVVRNVEVKESRVAEHDADEKGVGEVAEFGGA